MPEKRFARLLAPGRIGKVETRNRMIKTGAGTSFIEKDGTVGEAMKAFYGSLARGGVGLIIVESCGVDYPLGVHHLAVHARLNEDRYIPGYAELTKVVHDQGCPVFIQLFHSGPVHPYAQTGLVPIASSELTPGELKERGLEKLHGLTLAEVEDVVEKFASAAERARRAGFDGVEVNANSSHLIHTFLSRAWNRRQDIYGGDLPNRARILTDIIREIKRRSGQDFAIEVLITGLELGIENGITLDEAVQFARLIQEAGADAIQTRAFGHKEYKVVHPGPERLLYPEPPESLPAELDWSRHGAGAFVPLTAALKKAVQIPVIAVGRLDPELGEEILAGGRADFIGLHRRLLSDPQLPNKVAAGQLDDVACCSACYFCWHERNANRYVRCRINPALGREREYTISPAEKRKRVLVVGGGPAGLEAARVAALRGHKVVLYEKQPKLGGSLPIAGLVKGFEIEDILTVSDYLSRQIAKAGVEVHLGSGVTPALVEDLKPDAIVLATGGIARSLDVPGADSRKVVKSSDLHRQLKFWLRFMSPRLLRRLTKLWMPVGTNVVIVGGGIQACQLAEFLVTRNRKVTIVDSAEAIGEDIVPPDTRERLLGWLASHGVAMATGATCNAITDHGLHITTAKAAEVVLPADTIIPALSLAPERDLYRALAGKAAEVFQVGDCREPALTPQAVADGARVGHLL